MAAEQREEHQNHRQKVSEATQHHAETRDPPSQDLRDHMAQAVKDKLLSFWLAADTGLMTSRKIILLYGEYQQGDPNREDK